VKTFLFGLFLGVFLTAFGLSLVYDPLTPCRCLDCKCCPACPCPDDCHDKPEPCKDS
jgi:hypothetical protein